jgi:hypothetical protein
MGHYVRRLNRPYDYHVLIEAYIYTQRTDFVNLPAYSTYYASVLEALERQFGIRMSTEGLAFTQKVLWMLFQGTVRSLLRITSPWSDFLDETLLVKKLEENGELRTIVDRASRVIGEANMASEAAHREMLDALFKAIFGVCQRVVTSNELRAAGFDDSREPDFADYYDNM